MGALLFRIWYYLRVAIKSIRHSLFLSIISVGTTAVALLLVGIFLIAQVNLKSLRDRILRDLHISAYLRDDITDQQIKELIAEVKAWDEVATVRYVSADEAWDEAKKLLPPEVVAGLDAKHLPLEASLEIVLKKRSRTPDDFDDIVGRGRELSQVSGVYSVDYGESGIRVVIEILEAVEFLSLLVSAIIILAAIFFIVSTIKLSVYARHEEIEILKLVGGTNHFIRMPFYIEGLLQGGLGALLAINLLLLVRHRFEVLLRNVHHLQLEIQTLPQFVVILFVVGGILLGLLGSALSVGRYLKV